MVSRMNDFCVVIEGGPCCVRDGRDLTIPTVWSINSRQKEKNIKVLDSLKPLEMHHHIL